MRPWSRSQVLILRVIFPITRRALTLTSRGKSISRDELFSYTGGRFLIDDRERCQSRNITFDLDELCKVIVSAGPTQSDVRSIDKADGISNKILWATKEDGSQVVVKIPYRKSGPVSFATSSEVANLKFLTEHTTLPVPKVYHWSSDASNAVGVEYIIMEKMPGRQLYWIWNELDLRVRADLIKSLVDYESQLASIEFPAYGNLYLRQYLQDKEFFMVPLDHRTDSSQSFAVGPAHHRTWHSASEKLWHASCERGPMSLISEFGVFYAQQAIQQIHQDPPAFEDMYEITPEERVNLLEKAIKVMTALEHFELFTKQTFPALWRTSLEMGSILVSETDPPTITAILDWRSVDVSPFYLQARVPTFLLPPDDYKYGLETEHQPKLPDDFSELDENSQAEAQRRHQQALNTKAYEALTHRLSPKVHAALEIPILFDIFAQVAETDQGPNIVLLEKSLIDLYTQWPDLELAMFPECPISFSAAEIAKSKDRIEAYQASAAVVKMACEQLDVSQSGFVQPGQDLEEVQKLNKQLLQGLLEHATDSNQYTHEEAEEIQKGLREIWPFKEGL